MKKILILLFLFVFPLFALEASQQQEKAFVVNVSYDQGVVTIQNVSSAMRFIPLQQPENEMSDKKYWLELISLEGKILEKRLFDFNLLVSAEPPIEGEEDSIGGGTFELEQAEDEVVLPYHGNAKFIFLYDLNYRKIAQKDISDLAEFCGDKICQSNEDISNCPADCSVVKNINDKVKESEINLSKKENSYYIFYLLSLAGLIFAVISVYIVFLKLRKKKNNDLVEEDEYKENFDIDKK